MAKKKFTVLGLEIRIEAIDRNDYISLTDIAKNNSARKPNSVLISWLRNQNTISFLKTLLLHFLGAKTVRLLAYSFHKATIW